MAFVTHKLKFKYLLKSSKLVKHELSSVNLFNSAVLQEFLKAVHFCLSQLLCSEKKNSTSKNAVCVNSLQLSLRGASSQGNSQYSMFIKSLLELV